MRSILEKALTYLLNEEHDKAEELFHKFIIERARQIHESLRQGDDKIDEDWNEDVTENYFTEDDLSDTEDGEGEGDFVPDEGEGDEGGEAPEMGGDVADDDGMPPMDGVDGDPDAMGGDEEPGTIEDQFAELKDVILDMKSQLDAMMGTDSTEGDGMDDGMGGDMDDDGMGGDMDDGMGGGGMDKLAGAGDDGMGGEGPIDSGEIGDGDEEMEDESFAPHAMHMESEETDDDDEELKEEDDEELDEDDDFDDISESIVSELEKVSVSLTTDGEEIATGKKFTQNTVSPIPQRKVNDRAKNAKPVVMGQGKGHTGYERETPAPVKDTKFYSKVQNVKKTAEEGRTKVNKETKGTLIGSLKSEDGNQKSPIGSKGTVGNNGGVSS